MLCTFDDKGVCSRCGRFNRSGNPALRANCKEDACPHLGLPVGEVKVQCETCKGKTLVAFPAHKCDTHRRCLPTFVPIGEALEKWHDRKPESDIYTLCCECPDNPSNQPRGL